MTARYSAVEGALPSGFASAGLHHLRAHDRRTSFRIVGTLGKRNVQPGRQVRSTFACARRQEGIQTTGAP
jgi:hypothetical protein